MTSQITKEKIEEKQRIQDATKIVMAHEHLLSRVTAAEGAFLSAKLDLDEAKAILAIFEAENNINGTPQKD